MKGADRKCLITIMYFKTPKQKRTCQRHKRRKLQSNYEYKHQLCFTSYKKNYSIYE